MTIENIIWIFATLAVYLLSLVTFKFLGKRLIWHPILLGAFLIAIICYWVDTSVVEYQQHVGLLNWLLGPATVALAVPLYKHVKTIISCGWKGIILIVIGGSLAPLIAYFLLYILDFSDVLTRSMLTKSITTPLAMDTAMSIDSLPEIAAVVVILTGIFGVAISAAIFKLSNCHNEVVQGITLGTITHAVGTSRAAQLGERQAAFATMALCVNGILTAIILPILFNLFG